MTSPSERAVAIVGVGAILPDAPNAAAFWENLRAGRYSISDVDPARWDPALYFDADHAPERTYSKIGGWVRDWEWNPLGWKLPIPPKVSDAMDDAQKWAIACTRMALEDYGKPFDRERTAVILGNAMAGEKHYFTTLRLLFPELRRDLDGAPSFAALPADLRTAIMGELHARMESDLPEITEDTMPGELSNCLAGRVANLFNFRGPNFIIDAACASAMAAMDASIEGLVEGQFDTVITGGVDRNMGVSSFIKFCAIGALSATGTRPYADGADGFVMGEGAALFILRRLADAERDGDRIYAVVRGMAGSSDGKGKGITAPNPIGQKLAIARAWENAGLSPASCSLIEGHGTSTSVGDFVELSSLVETFAGAGLAPGSVALGSVKSNIGHLKAAAGAAGMLKATLSLYHKTLAPSLGFERPNPNVDWAASPFAVNTQLREWDLRNGDPRDGGRERVRLRRHQFPRCARGAHSRPDRQWPGPRDDRRAGGPAWGGQAAGRRARGVPRGRVGHGRARDAAALGDPRRLRPRRRTSRRAERVCIDYGDADELAAKAAMALKALESGNPAAWKALEGRGIFRGSGAPGKVAFLYTGQGSQYAKMLAELRATEPIVAATFDEADAIMRPLLDGRALSEIIFDAPDADAQLMRTEITQPAVLTVDIALTRLLAARGFAPDMVMGHSLGEYGALVAAGVLSFADALEAVSARGREMASVSIGDNGAMAAVSAPIDEVDADRRRGRRLRRARQRQLPPAARDRRRDRGRRAGDREDPRGRAPRAAAAGLARVPHRDRRARRRAAAGDARPGRDHAAARADRGQRRRRVLPARNRPRDRHPRTPDRLAGAVHQGPAHTHDAGARVFVEVGPEAGAVGVRRRRARRRRAQPLHQPSEGGRHGRVQPGPVRALVAGFGRRPCRPPPPVARSDEPAS